MDRVTRAAVIALALLGATPALARAQSIDENPLAPLGLDRTPAGAARAEDAAAPQAGIALASGVRLALYGTLRLDVVADTRRLAAPRTVTRAPDRLANDNAETFLSARQTMLGLTLDAPWALAGVGGRLEVDLLGQPELGVSGDPLTPRLRLRLAYVQAWLTESWSLVLGQAGSVLAPQTPGVADAWRGWGAGNLGGWRPQVRLSYTERSATATPNGLALRASFAVVDPRGGAFDGLDADGRGVEDGRAAGLPAVQMRLGLRERGAERAAPPFVFGIGAHLGRERVDRPGADPNRYETTAYAVAADFVVPIGVGTGLVLRGEFWFGRNVDGLWGGLGLPGFDLEKLRGVDAHGGWLELTYRPAGSADWWIAALWGLDDPSRDDLYLFEPVTPGQPQRNQFITGALWWRPAPTIGVTLGVSWWKTEHYQAIDTESWRIQITTLWDF